MIKAWIWTRSIWNFSFLSSTVWDAFRIWVTAFITKLSWRNVICATSHGIAYDLWSMIHREPSRDVLWLRNYKIGELHVLLKYGSYHMKLTNIFLLFTWKYIIFAYLVTIVKKSQPKCLSPSFSENLIAGYSFCQWHQALSRMNFLSPLERHLAKNNMNYVVTRFLVGPTYCVVVKTMMLKIDWNRVRYS